MSATSVVSIEKIAARVGVSLAPGGPLDQEVTEDHLIRDVCGFVVQWESLAERLGVGEADLEGAKEDGPDARRKRELVLKKWKAAQIFDATYRRLGEEFHGLGRADLCLKVFELAKAAASASNSSEGPGPGNARASTGTAATNGKSQPQVLAPSPAATEFTENSMIDDLEDVTDWYGLGIQLSIKPAKLDKLEGDYHKADMRKNKMLMTWYKQETSASPHKEALLFNALEKIGEKVLAQKLRRKYSIYS